ncbi:MULTISPECIES: helix-turn-helix domain-containing protein [unclassified Crossiella]|uniref:helix-turn-helix domain-containing protein n=1 Tax=unclassified Crossiella TaxID=2620835 RepID=UPI001FFE395F|nr:MULTISPECIES: helix-turn-helix domain-containing protein [unclassified Crossiella]MCK2244043.1 helix-turn-helix domain-containing protein [Crossiella sp. S99.2]MCK2257099.1 helix-turn-helix domain-containing protein [Crossiella sp. S99.1]
MLLTHREISVTSTPDPEPLRGRRRRRVAAELASRFAAGAVSIPELAADLRRGPALVRRLLIEAGVRTDNDTCLRASAADLTADLVRRHRAGESIEHLSRRTGIDRRAIRRLLAEGGVPQPVRARQPTATELVIEGYRSGASIRQLAARFGSSYSAVRTLLRNAGVGLRSRGHGVTAPRDRYS